MELKKKNFIEAYKKSYGNISESCKAISISRITYYRWLKSDKEFKEQIEAIEPDEEFLDFLENKAKERIEEGSDSVLIFALKAKGKKRGWIEKQIIEQENKEVEDRPDYSNLSTDELKQLIELRKKLIRGGAERDGSSSSDA